MTLEEIITQLENCGELPVLVVPTEKQIMIKGMGVIEKQTCPNCGFLSRLIRSDGHIETYNCDRCHTSFIVSAY